MCFLFCCKAARTHQRQRPPFAQKNTPQHTQHCTQSNTLIQLQKNQQPNNNNKKFHVADGELSCQLYQRSADVGLGVPFNIASYALLTLMLAQVAGLAAGELVHVLGDAHVYANHVEPLSSQLANAPRHLPTLRINAAKTEIDAFEPSDFELDGYRPHKKIAMTMAV